jgi:hypothetical protein
VAVTKNDSVKNFKVNWKDDMKATDSLSVAPVQKGGLNFREKFQLTPSTPLIAIDSTKISVVNKDSLAIKYTVAYNDFEQRLEIDFPKEESQKYTVTLLPGALRDFYEKENDSLTYSLATRTYAEYGNLRITLQNVNRFPLLLEITDVQGKVLGSHYSEGETVINFDNVLPNKYLMRVIYDDNKNGEWDTGSYLEKRQPEEVIYFKGGQDNTIDVRANWDVDQEFNLAR